MEKECGCVGEHSRPPPHELLKLTLSIRHWDTSPIAMVLIIVIGGLCMVDGSMGVPVHIVCSVARTREGGRRRGAQSSKMLVAFRKPF